MLGKVNKVLKPLIMGNWKMNGKLAESEMLVRQLVTLVDGCSKVEVCLCPPFTLLLPAKAWLESSNIVLGAQNAHFAEKGAFTGEISPHMLQELGCSYVILGHSERRLFALENDELLAQKVQAVQSLGLTPVLCVGESLEQRENGQGEEYVLSQLRRSLALAEASPLVIAYEPTWAIGTGRAASVKEAEPMLFSIRHTLVDMFGKAGLEVRLLYGGSVTSANIGEYMDIACVNGALVGGASLKAQEFAAIVSRVEEGTACISR